MSLLRLLTAGKSLVDVGDSRSRYQLTHKKLLPKFGLKSNPFRAKGHAEPAPAGAGPQATPAARAGDSKRPNRLSAAAASPARSGAVGSAAADQNAPATDSGWADKLAAKVSLLLTRPPGPARSAIPRFAKPPVQAELSLDSIKVVRNDLRDSDLEVVPAGGPAGAPRNGQRAEAKAPLLATIVGTNRTAWGRVSARLFGARRTLT